MNTQTLTLTEFLLARLAEDEAAARAAIWSDDATDPVVLYELSDETLAFVRRHDPAHVLAKVQADRAVVEVHPSGTWTDTGKNECDGCLDYWPCRTLRFLAQPYADYLDFQPEWRVSPATPTDS